jgi:translation initiation factor 2 subunit 2
MGRRTGVTLSARPYRELLDRIKSDLPSEGAKRESRLVLPAPVVVFVGSRTIFRNFREVSTVVRREPSKVLMYLAKELATAASLDAEGRAIFIGRRGKDSFAVLLERYVKENVICPVCGSPDTHIEKLKKVSLLVCEACGAKSPAKG